MEIEFFQLENLLVSRTQFQFLDLRLRVPADTPVEIQRLLHNSVRVKADDVVGHLSGTEKDRPVVLFCEDGQSSRHVAQRLEAAGFTHVYTVVEGEVGLRSELARDESLSSNTK